jgi:ketosteroid isomerase-like protein
MSQENVEIIRRAIDQLNETGDPDWDLYDPELVWTMRPDGPAHITRHGLQGLREGIESLREVWSEIRLEIVEVIESGEIVVVVLSERLRAQSGVELEAVEAWANWFRDGKLVRIEQHGSKQEALEAVGLSE